jgi:hypothetical protein
VHVSGFDFGLNPSDSSHPFHSAVVSKQDFNFSQHPLEVQPPAVQADGLDFGMYPSSHLNSEQDGNVVVVVGGVQHSVTVQPPALQVNGFDFVMNPSSQLKSEQDGNVVVVVVVVGGTHL